MCALILFFTPVAKAETGFFIGAGMLGQHVYSVSGDETGKEGLMGGTYPQASIGFGMSAALISANLQFMPTLSYTMPGRLLNDDAGRVNVWTVALPFMAKVAFFDFKLGIGMQFSQYRGNGSTSTLPDAPDGSGTATYYRPRDSVTSKTFLTDIGAGFDFGGGVRLDLDLYINGILSLKRDFSLAAGLAYFFK
ncbi:MAG: hypothetical protein ABL958_16295 [Bdellovibrionia bacterium]